MIINWYSMFYGYVYLNSLLMLNFIIYMIRRYNIPDDAYSLLQSSRNIGQVCINCQNLEIVV